MPHLNLQYPASGAECIDDRMRFRRATLRAVRWYAGVHPWRGTPAARREKLRMLHRRLCDVYGKTTRLEFHRRHPACYIQAMDCIVLPGVSVVTYLHEFGHALGRDERGACRWSLNLFKRVFPQSFGRCHFEGHMLVRGAG